MFKVRSIYNKDLMRDDMTVFFKYHDGTEYNIIFSLGANASIDDYCDCVEAALNKIVDKIENSN